MENPGIALATMKEVVRAGSKKYRLSLPAGLCDVWSRIPDVMLCLDLLYQYHYDHADAIKFASYDNISEAVR